MARRLKTFVHVGGNAYGPGDDVPPEVAEQIGDHAWQSGDDDQGDAEPHVGFEDPTARKLADTEPPRSGRGSGVEAWRTFAEQHGVGTDSDMSREDIIAACEAAGVVEPEQPKE